MVSYDILGRYHVLISWVLMQGKRVEFPVCWSERECLLSSGISICRKIKIVSKRICSPRLELAHTVVPPET